MEVYFSSFIVWSLLEINVMTIWLPLKMKTWATSLSFCSSSRKPSKRNIHIWKRKFQVLSYVRWQKKNVTTIRKLLKMEKWAPSLTFSSPTKLPDVSSYWIWDLVSLVLRLKRVSPFLTLSNAQVKKDLREKMMTLGHHAEIWKQDTSHPKFRAAP